MIRIWVDQIQLLMLRRRHIFAYIASGVGAVIVDYTTFITAYYVFRLPVALAAPAGLTVGFIASFLLNKLWTFKRKTRSTKKETTTQVMLYFLLFLLNNLFTIYFIKLLFSLGVSVAIGKLMSTGMITLWNYILYKKIIFRQSGLTEFDG